jgi:hypothetical protein
MLVAYGDSEDEEENDLPAEPVPDAEEQPSAPQSMFGCLPTPLSTERELEQEKERKKLKKAKKKAKKAAAAEAEAKRLQALEEKKKLNPHGVLLMKPSLNVAPSLEAAHAKVTAALTQTPAPTPLPVIPKAPDSRGRLVLLDQRRRGFAATGDAAMGSFSLNSQAFEASKQEEITVEYAIAPTNYANATTAGRPTLKGRYYTKALPEGPHVAGPVDLDLGEQGSHVPQATIPCPGYPTDQQQYEEEEEEAEAPDGNNFTMDNPALRKMLGKNLKFDPGMLVDVNAEALRQKTRAEQMEADFDTKNSAPVVEVKASFWNSKAGETITTTKGTKLHKRKHQINTLAAESAAREHELNKWRATGKAHLAQAKARYGW